MGTEPFLVANAINSRGETIGRSQTGAYYWDSAGQRSDLSALVGAKVNALGNLDSFGDINDSGQIAIPLESLAGAVSTSRTPLDLFANPAGYFGVRLTALNNQGIVAGYVQDNNSSSSLPDPAHRLYGFLRRPNGVTVKIGNGFMPTALNNTNQVVGFNNGASVWDEAHGVTQLNSAIPAGSGWTLNEAHGINDRGEIVGMGLIHGDQHAFLLTPL